MIVDGKAIAARIKQELKREAETREHPARLAVVMAGSDPASESYVKRKQKFGADIGIAVETARPEGNAQSDPDAFRAFLARIGSDGAYDGVIVQLPLPEPFAPRTQEFLDLIPAGKDVDVLSSCAVGQFVTGHGIIEPTLVGAVKAIFDYHEIDIRGKAIAIAGASGRLVGKPIALWLLRERLPFVALNSKTPPEEFRRALKYADIIISGIGKSGSIAPDMVKDGVIAIDAGTSGASGALKGDMDPSVAERAALFTPVPGGVGPLTVAMLFRNLFALAKQK